MDNRLHQVRITKRRWGTHKKNLDPEILANHITLFCNTKFRGRHAAGMRKRCRVVSCPIRRVKLVGKWVARFRNAKGYCGNRKPCKRVVSRSTMSLPEKALGYEFQANERRL